MGSYTCRTSSPDISKLLSSTFSWRRISTTLLLNPHLGSSSFPGLHEQHHRALVNQRFEPGSQSELNSARSIRRSSAFARLSGFHLAGPRSLQPDDLPLLVLHSHASQLHVNKLLSKIQNYFRHHQALTTPRGNISINIDIDRLVMEIVRAGRANNSTNGTRKKKQATKKLIICHHQCYNN